MKNRWLITVLLVVLISFPLQAEPELSIENGDHVTIVGSGLAERMNHFGYFETLLYARFPRRDLVVRNLGYGGDVVNEKKNLRAVNFPDRDEWLDQLDTDVIIAMYGFNASFRGAEHVEAFREQLNAFVEHARNREYNGSSPPRMALISPIAFEDLNDPHLPVGTEQNKHLERYTEAIQSVAEEHNLPFVDLFSVTRRAYASDDTHWTFNGVHLTERGYRNLAPFLDRALFGSRDVDIDWSSLSNLRAAVNDKNSYWFDRYRVNDKNDIYGTRSDLSYEPNNTSNREVLRHELTILDRMVENRERKVWAVAQDRDYTVKDNNLPEPMEVETNAPGDGPDGKHTFLGGNEAIEKMDVHENMSVNLFASEEQFPELINPVQIKFDTEGRLWVAAWEGYPTYRPPGKKRDELIVLEDTDGDGRADERTIFADQLKDPTGFHFWNDGVIVTQPPYVIYVKDTDGDGKADHRRRLLSHVSAADTHSAMNNYVWDAGGKLFLSEGYLLKSQIETPYGPVRNRDGAVWSFDPETFRVRRYITKNFANTHGHDVTRWNQGFVNDATPAHTYHDTLFSGFIPYPQQHPEPPRLYKKRTRPASAIRILSSRHFPERFQGDLLVANVIGVQGFQRYDITRDGASFQGTEKEPIVTSGDPNFRPADMAVGPRGALYLADWHNPLIGHMQHHIRDPSRDHEHGRIYRVTYDGRPLAEPRNIEQRTIPELLDLLTEPGNRVRTRVKLSLETFDREKVLDATETWINELSPERPGFEHHVLEGLWVYQWQHEVNLSLLKRALKFDTPRARAAAVRVLTYWRDDVEGARELMETMVHDPDPLVRLEAVRGLSFFESWRAASIALQALQHETDQYLEFTLNETIRTLKPYWKNAMAQGKPVVHDHDQALSYLLDRLANDEQVRELLLAQPGTSAVNRAILFRTVFSVDRRLTALKKLAESQDRQPADLLLEHLMETEAGASLVPLLEEMDRDRLAPHANRLAELARNPSSPGVREAAFIALATIDGNVDRVRSLASGSAPNALRFLNALASIQNEEIRSSAYSFVKSLVFDPPARSSSDARTVFDVSYYGTNTHDAKRSTFETHAPETAFRADRITTDLEPVRSGGDTFSLMYRGRMEIRTPGTYTFHLTSDDGSRLYVDGEEVVNNDGSHAPREKSGRIELANGLHDLLITHFDSGGGHTLSLKWTPPGSDEKQEIPGDVFVGRSEVLQKRAIGTLSELPVPADKRFADLIEAMDRTDHVLTAAHAARNIAPDLDTVPAELAETASRAILSFARSLSASRRSKENVSEVISFGENLTRYIEGKTGARRQRKLAQLSVRKITIRAVPGEMRYDTESFTVLPGETIAIVLRNPDEIPHNLVITAPGAYEEVGKASMDQQDGASHEYIPQKKGVQNKILRHTTLLASGESERLILEVPDTPDDYPYLCTFPGHWRTMKGVMHVISEEE